MNRLDRLCLGLATECMSTGSVQWLQCDGWDHGYYYVRHEDPTMLSKITFRSETPESDQTVLVGLIAEEIKRRYREVRCVFHYQGKIAEGKYAGLHDEHDESVRESGPKYVYEYVTRYICRRDPYSIRWNVRNYLRNRNLNQGQLT